jgi:hypothetical protein
MLLEGALCPLAVSTVCPQGSPRSAFPVRSVNAASGLARGRAGLLPGLFANAAITASRVVVKGTAFMGFEFYRHEESNQLQEGGGQVSRTEPGSILHARPS